MELARLIAEFATVDGVHRTSIPRLDLVRFAHPTEPVHAMHEQAVVIVAQGTKEVTLGRTTFVNGPEQFLIVSVDVPIVGRVIEASSEKPYLCMRLHLNPETLGELLRDGHGGEGEGDDVEPGLSLGCVTPELVAAATRLVALLSSPRDVRVLAPLAEREIHYRLLLSDQAGRLRRIASADSKLSQIGKAIDLIKQNFDKPIRVEDVARAASMSASALHRHFRAVTALSPLQFQKRIRLQEARSLIFSRAMDAAVAGHQVGYESPSQFSRDYKRLFGVPPMRDLRSGARMQSAS